MHVGPKWNPHSSQAGVEDLVLAKTEVWLDFGSFCLNGSSICGVDPGTSKEERCWTFLELELSGSCEFFDVCAGCQTGFSQGQFMIITPETSFQP